MYKVVIIDDEPIIVEGLTKILPWEKWDCRVVATALDGLEGAEVIRRERPNIVISDIAMPGLDGLKMVAGLKSEFEDMEISILTGYRDFDYAREAIRLGVTRFMLKPSKTEELMEAVEAMVVNLKKKKITGEAAEEKESAAGSFIVNNALEYLREHYAEKITLGELADKIYVSQWHLSKLLNRHTGQNFSEILGSIRIEKAKELMKDPALRIGDVAEQVGFQDIAHFSRVFKKHVGMSANEYRNEKFPLAK
ncbi:MAG: response regulator [Candidatus Limivivens sp.]|nr:response regulator [Candidatus Limivivens sp.]